MSADLADLGSTRCRTESDVEQKIVLPLLTAAEWLRIPLDNLFTKQYLPAVLIDKGRRKISYFPDYSIWIGGLPIGIVEVKSPAEDPASEIITEPQNWSMSQRSKSSLRAPPFDSAAGCAMTGASMRE